MKPEKKNNENAASTISNMRVQLQRLQQHQYFLTGGVYQQSGA